MAGKSRESSSGAEAEQHHLLQRAAEVLGVKTSELKGWKINYISSEGLINAEIPIDAVDATGLPTDPLNLDDLIVLLQEFEEEMGGGTGQRDPVVVCHVPGEAFYLVDGFHRHEAQALRGKSTLLATIEPNKTYEQVVKRQLEYTTTHAEVEFARQVLLMQSVWERTEWAAQIPQIMTAFRAVKEDYAYDGTDDVELINDLSDKDYADICNWAKKMSKEWGYTPKEIREQLALSESFDPNLMFYVYQKKGTPPEGKIGRGHIEPITEIYAGEFDFQARVVELIIEHHLTIAQTRAVLHEIENSNTVSLDEMNKAIDELDIDYIVTKTNRAVASSRSVGSRAPKASISDASTSELILALQNRFSNGAESNVGDPELAIDVVAALSRAIIKLGEAEPRSLRQLQSSLGILATTFVELSDDLEGTAQFADDKDSDGEKAETDDAKKLLDSYTKFLRGQTTRIPHINTVFEYDLANKALAKADVRWSKKRREEFENAIFEGEERISRRRERTRGSA